MGLRFAWALIGFALATNVVVGFAFQGLTGVVSGISGTLVPIIFSVFGVLALFASAPLMGLDLPSPSESFVKFAAAVVGPSPAAAMLWLSGGIAVNNHLSPMYPGVIALMAFMALVMYPMGAIALLKEFFNLTVPQSIAFFMSIWVVWELLERVASWVGVALA